jgi:hypothetical protein
MIVAIVLLQIKQITVFFGIIPLEFDVVFFSIVFKISKDKST